MELVETEVRYNTALTLHENFIPVNDEYRPFKLIARRNSWQQSLEVPLMVKALRLPSYQRVLEIGCGQGFALTALAQHCRPTRLVGVDIDHFLLKDAEKRIRKSGIRAELYQEDVRRLPFADACFDLVIDFGTTYHLNRRLKALKEIARVLSHGGIFAYETPLNQILSHPLRSRGRRIRWDLAAQLQSRRAAVLWSSRSKVSI